MFSSWKCGAAGEKRRPVNCMLGNFFEGFGGLRGILVVAKSSHRDFKQSSFSSFCHIGDILELFWTLCCKYFEFQNQSQEKVAG